MKKILVVDDVAISLSVTERALKEYYDVVTINSGLRALRYLEENKPDLILLDIKMEPIDGIQTLKRIREMKKRADIPVIMLTSRDDSISVVESTKLKISGYVLKPFKEKDLRERIERVLNEKKSFKAKDMREGIESMLNEMK